MIGYDAGALDAADGAMRVNFFNIDNPTRPLELRDLQVLQLPRVASIDTMVAGSKLLSWQGLPVRPWRTERPLPCGGGANRDGCSAKLGASPTSIIVSNLAQGRHIAERFDGACLKTSTSIGPVSAPRDSVNAPDVNECPNAGFSLDLFPATMLYITATVVDPAAQHWDVTTKKMITGPVVSRVFYQLAGRHPDLNRNGIDDYIDIATGRSKDPDHSGVPNEVKRCSADLTKVDRAELAERNARMILNDAERRMKACRERCRQEERVEKRVAALHAKLLHEEFSGERALKEFKHCEASYGLVMDK